MGDVVLFRRSSRSVNSAIPLSDLDSMCHVGFLQLPRLSRFFLYHSAPFSQALPTTTHPPTHPITLPTSFFFLCYREAAPCHFVRSRYATTFQNSFHLINQLTKGTRVRRQLILFSRSPFYLQCFVLQTILSPSRLIIRLSSIPVLWRISFIRRRLWNIYRRSILSFGQIF